MGKKKDLIKISEFYNKELIGNRLVIKDGIEIIDSDFFAKSNIKDVIFPKSLKVIELCAFDRCENIIDLILNEGLEEIGEAAFQYCSNLERITLPQSLRKIGKFAFWDCENLREIVIPGGVKRIEFGAFNWCKSLSKVILKEGIETVCRYSFEYCSKLKEIVLPSTLKELELEAFPSCPTLRKVTVPIETFIDLGLYDYPIFKENAVVFDILCGSKGYKHYYKNNKKVFDELERQERLIVRAQDFEKKSYYDYSSYNRILDRSMVANDRNISSYVVADGIEKISANTFKDFNNLKRVTIPDSVKVIEAGAFENCPDLKEVNLGNGLVEIRNNVFDGCFSLERIVIPSSVKSIGSSCFKNCTDLKSVILKEGIENLGENAFYGCDSLKELTIPGSLKKVRGNWFLRNTGIEEVTLRNGITGIEDNAFYMCKHLKKVHFPSSLKTIGNYAFANCCKLKKLKLPKGVTSIGEFAFLDCNSITEIELPADLYEIHSGALDGTSITELVLPTRLRCMDISVLSDVKTLEKVKFYYNNFDLLYYFVKANKEALYNFYVHKGKKSIEFIGYELSKIEKLKLLLLLNVDAYVLKEPEIEKQKNVVDEDEIVLKRYTSNDEIDLLINKIKKESNSLVPYSKDIVDSAIEYALGDLKKFKENKPIENTESGNIIDLRYLESQLMSFSEVVDGKITYGPYRTVTPLEIINRTTTKLQRILDSMKEINKYNEIIEQVEYYQGIVNGKYSNSRANDFISEDLVNTMKSLDLFPKKYQDNNRKKLVDMLDKFLILYVSPEILSVIYTNPSEQNQEIDLRAKLAMLVGNANQKVSNDLAVLKQYELLLNGLKGYKYTFSNELIDNISSLKEKIASLPDGDFKIKMQNDFNKVIGDNIELVSNIIQVIDSYSLTKYNQLTRDISAQLQVISTNIDEYNRQKRAELSENIYEYGKYYTISETGQTSIHITGNKTINDLITEVYNQSNFLPSSFKELINNKVKNILKEYRQAEEEFAPCIDADIKPEVHFGDPVSTRNNVVHELEGLLLILEDVQQFRSKLKQVDYYFDLLKGSEINAKQNDFVSEDIVRILGLIERFPIAYQKNTKLELEKILTMYKQNVSNDIYTLFDDNPFTNPGDKDYRTDLSMQMGALSSKVNSELRVYNKYILLRNALGELKTTANDDEINNILALYNLISNLEEKEIKEELLKDFEIIRNEGIISITNMIDNAVSYPELKYTEFILGILTKMKVLETKLDEYTKSSAVDKMMQAVKVNLGKSKAYDVKMELLECLHCILNNLRVNVPYEHKSLKGIIFDFFNSVVDNDILTDKDKKYVVDVLINAINHQLMMIEDNKCTPDNAYKMDILFGVITDLELKLTWYLDKKTAYDDVFNNDNISF